MCEFIGERHRIRHGKSGRNEYEGDNSAPATEQHGFAQRQHSRVIFPHIQLVCPQLSRGPEDVQVPQLQASGLGLVSHALTHSHTHAHSHSRTHSPLTHTHRHTHRERERERRTHTHTHSLTHSLTHSHTRTHTHAHTHAHTQRTASMKNPIPM